MSIDKNCHLQGPLLEDEVRSRQVGAIRTAIRPVNTTVLHRPAPQLASTTLHQNTSRLHLTQQAEVFFVRLVGGGLFRREHEKLALNTFDKISFFGGWTSIKHSAIYYFPIEIEFSSVSMINVNKVFGPFLKLVSSRQIQWSLITHVRVSSRHCFTLG